MIGALIGAGISAIGSMVGSAMSSAATRAAERARLKGIEKQRTRNENLLNYRMGSPRYAAQTQLNQLADKLRDRKSARTGTQKVMGGTQAAVQAGDNSDAQVLGNTTETAVSQALEDRKSAMQDYTNAQNNLDAQEANVKADAQEARSQNVADATKALSQTAAQIAGTLDNGSSTTGNTTSGNDAAHQNFQNAQAQKAEFNAVKAMAQDANAKNVELPKLAQATPVQDAAMKVQSPTQTQIAPAKMPAVTSPLVGKKNTGDYLSSYEKYNFNSALDKARKRL